jgi:nitrogen fixation-related uncharacterized protein
VFEASIHYFNFAVIVNFNRKLPKNKEKSAKCIRLIVLYSVIGVALMLFWLALVSYSMTSTVSGQYDQLKTVETTRISTTNIEDEAKDKNNNIDSKIALLKEDNQTLKAELDNLLLRAASIDTVENRYKYRRTTGSTESRIDSIRDKIQENNNSIADLLTQKDINRAVYIDTFNVDQGNVYEYFSKITGFSPLLIQFILSMFPSIFVDVMCPVCLAIVLYRRRNKTNEDKK